LKNEFFLDLFRMIKTIFEGDKCVDSLASEFIVNTDYGSFGNGVWEDAGLVNDWV